MPALCGGRAGSGRCFPARRGRRARLRATANWGPFGAHYSLDAGSGTVRTTDLYILYEPEELRWRLQAGYALVPQPHAFAYTSHTRIDAVERAAIAERWARGTSGPLGRAFGLFGRYRAGDFVANLGVHGGGDSFDGRGGTSAAASSATSPVG